MEDNNSISTENEQNNNELSFSKTSIGYLTETGKWTKFLAIVGFIGVGIIVVIGLFAGTIISTLADGQVDGMPAGFGPFLSLVYILMGLLYFFPAWYLYKFSQKMRVALTSKDSNTLAEAFENQKSFFKFFGILTIIGIGFYILFAIIGGFASFI